MSCGLYYKPMMVINDNSRVVNKLEAWLTDDTRVIIYDHHMFIVQATELTFFYALKVKVIQWLFGLGVCRIHFSGSKSIFPAGFTAEGNLTQDPAILM